MHHRLLRSSATLATALVVAMFALYLATGVGQEALQEFVPPDVWARRLAARPAVMAATLALDNGFIVAYVTAFVALALVRWPARRARALTVGAVALLVTTGAFDLAENFDFLVHLRAVTAGIAPTAAEVQARVAASWMKFHLSYLGLFWLGWSLPRATWLERGLAFGLRWVQLPVGLAIAVVPRAVAVPLVLVRFAFFCLGMLALRAAAARPGFARDEPDAAPEPSPVTAPIAAAPRAVGSGAPA
jgi:hypothetical protein